MKKLVILAVAIMAVAICAGPVFGWGMFRGDVAPYCSACHDPGMLHNVHGIVGCTSCHVDSGDIPLTHKCSMCHDAGRIVNFHYDAGIMECGVCHADLPNGDMKWGEVKSLFHD